MKRVFCGLLFVFAALIGYRAVTELMEDTRDFR